MPPTPPLPLTEAGSSGEGPSRRRPGSDDVYGRFGRVRSKNTGVRALADSSGRARLVIYDVSAGPSPSSNRAHGPDSKNQTDGLTSLAHSARGQTCFLFTSDEIHLRRSPKALHAVGSGYVLTYVPVIIQTCIEKEVALSFPLSPAFRFGEPCFVSKSGLTSKK